MFFYVYITTVVLFKYKLLFLACGMFSVGLVEEVIRWVPPRDDLRRFVHIITLYVNHRTVRLIFLCVQIKIVYR